MNLFARYRKHLSVSLRFITLLGLVTIPAVSAAAELQEFTDEYSEPVAEKPVVVKKVAPKAKAKPARSKEQTGKTDKEKDKEKSDKNKTDKTGKAEAKEAGKNSKTEPAKPAKTRKVKAQGASSGKPIKGIVKEATMGDRACYLTIKEDRGRTTEQYADFALCNQNPSLVGKRVTLSYQMQNIMALSCLGNPSCSKTEKVSLITKAIVQESNQAVKAPQTTTTP